MGKLTEYVEECLQKQIKKDIGKIKKEWKDKEGEAKDNHQTLSDAEIKDFEDQIAAAQSQTEKDYLMNLLGFFQHCTVCTHVGKFTHPGSRIIINDAGSWTNNGFVVTSNVNCIKDIVCSSSAYMPIAKFLQLELEDGRMLLEHLLESDKEVLDDLGQFGIQEDNIFEAIYSLAPNTVKATEKILKQVYFPVKEGAYHLLTVMPASSIMETLKVRIDQRIRENWASHNKKSDRYGQPCSRIPNRAVIYFGGTKPQNISTLNNRNGGKAYLLEALPPEFSNQAVRLPKRNFFQETISFRSVEVLLNHLHKLFKIQWNNVHIRNGIKQTIDQIADECIFRSDQIRQFPVGWSQEEKYRGLPLAQKIWLDDFYTDKRKNIDWIDSISEEFARWLDISYKRAARKERVKLEDAELKFFKYRMKSILREEMRNA